MKLLLLLALQVSSTELVEGSAFSLALRGRISGPSGSVGSHLSYRDFFDTGYGASLEGGWMKVEEAVGLGFYGSLAFDRFGGEGYEDDLGDRVSVEALDRLLFTAGGRVRFFLEEPIFQGNPLFIDVRAGFGVARYEQVEGDFLIGGTPTTDVEVIASSWRGAAEVGLSTGVASRTFTFVAGVGVRIIGGPETGDGVSSLIDPGLWVDLSFELGWEYRF